MSVGRIEKYKCVGEYPDEFSYEGHRRYLKTVKWRNIRDRRVALDGFKCKICGNIHRLNVHHITYKNWRHENIEDLITLCSPCHDKVHQFGHAIEDPNSIKKKVRKLRARLKKDKIKKQKPKWSNEKVAVERFMQPIIKRNITKLSISEICRRVASMYCDFANIKQMTLKEICEANKSVGSFLQYIRTWDNDRNKLMLSKNYNP